MSETFGTGIVIEKASIDGQHTFEQASQSHRDDYHLFFLQESGVSPIEIDFQKHILKPSSVTYINPNQVHRLGAFENVTVSFWVIDNENLNPEYLQLLEEILPAKPLILNDESFSVISETVNLCLKLSERKSDRLYHSLFKDSVNTLVGLVISQYLENVVSNDPPSRFEVITKAFKTILNKNFKTDKTPAAYAQRLNISTHYLNECVKNTTGHSVSHHIQQRIVLEAKRLLYHSDSTVKEIAAELGFDDYPYFSRIFSKVAGMTALTFRTKH